MAPRTHSPIKHEAICIFGTNPLDDLARARVHAALECAVSIRSKDLRLAFFGCHQPKMTYTIQSEAEMMWDYTMSCLEEALLRERDEQKRAQLQYLLHPDNHYLHKAPDVNSTSRTCKVIVEDYLAQGDTVHLIMTWFSTPRVYYLMYKQAKRAGLDWINVRNRIHIVPCRPAVKVMPMLREVGAWYKALKDPYSEKLNLDRKH